MSTDRLPTGAASSEQTIQKAVFQHLAVRAATGTFAFHPANGGWRSRTEAAILKGQGVTPGIPDVIAIRDGQVFGLELKSESGRLSPAQHECHSRLLAAGATVTTAMGLNHALGILETWGFLKGKTQ
jgi:hypothetical protein